MSDQAEGQTGAINRAAHVPLEVAVELGRVRLPLEEILNWSGGSLILLERPARGTVDVRVGGQPFARGEVVTLNESFGVRLTEMRPHPPPS